MSPVSTEDRVAAAEVRAMSEARRACQKARMVLAEIDDVTDAGYRPEVHDEDSAVVVIEDARFAALAVATGR